MQQNSTLLFQVNFQRNFSKQKKEDFSLKRHCKFCLHWCHKKIDFVHCRVHSASAIQITSCYQQQTQTRHKNKPRWDKQNNTILLKVKCNVEPYLSKQRTKDKFSKTLLQVLQSL